MGEEDLTGADRQRAGGRPSSRPSRYAEARARIRRRRAGALLGATAAAVAVAVAAWPAGGPDTPDVLTVVLKGERLGRIGEVRRERIRQGAALPVPSVVSIRRGSATVRYRIDRRGLRRAIRSRDEGVIRPSATPISSAIRAPIVKQRFRNNCETAALSMMLATRDVRRNQLVLQRQIRKDGPLDPQPGPAGQVWGDPDRGYVGRADGGGLAGGYGVYEQPVIDLARRSGVRLRQLRKTAQAVYDAVRQGRPVMVWIGLSDGPYRTWKSAAGRTIRGNFGEHTVVLLGIDGEQIRVNDPLDGQRERWTKEQFELMWARLGRRAISA